MYVICFLGMTLDLNIICIKMFEDNCLEMGIHINTCKFALTVIRQVVNNLKAHVPLGDFIGRGWQQTQYLS